MYPYLCELVKARRLDVIFLCETLSHSVKIDGIRSPLLYDYAFTVSCVW